MMFTGEIPGEAKNTALDQLEAAEKTLSPWRQMRLGKITGSCFNRVTRGRNSKEWSESAKSYMAELIFEWITGEEAQAFTGNDATRWGEFYENEALNKYTLKTGNTVTRGKFYLAKGFQGLVGCTPDGVGRKGLEIKCPFGPKAHTYALLSGKVPTEYTDQVFGHMLCAERDECDFVSYDPRISEKRPDLGLIVIPVERNEFYMEELTDRLYEFEEELISNLDKLEIDWRPKLAQQ